MNKIRTALLGYLIFPTLQFTYHNSNYDTPKLWPAFGVRIEGSSKLFLEFAGSLTPYKFATPAGPIFGAYHEWTEMQPTLYTGIGADLWKSAGFNCGIMKNKYELTGFMGVTARIGGSEK